MIVVQAGNRIDEAGRERPRFPSERIPALSSNRLKVGVRPEKISIAADGAPVPDGHNSITGRVVMSTYIGVSHQFKVEAAGGTELTVYVQNLGAQRSPGQGEQVLLWWKPEHTFAVEPQDDLSMEEDEDG